MSSNSRSSLPDDFARHDSQFLPDDLLLLAEQLTDDAARLHELYPAPHCHLSGSASIIQRCEEPALAPPTTNVRRSRAPIYAALGAAGLASILAVVMGLSFVGNDRTIARPLAQNPPGDPGSSVAVPNSVLGSAPSKNVVASTIEPDPTARMNSTASDTAPPSAFRLPEVEPRSPAGLPWGQFSAPELEGMLDLLDQQHSGTVGLSI